MVKIHYKSYWGIICILLGLLNTASYFRNDKLLYLIIGPFFLLLGLTYLTQPVMVISDKELKWNIFFGKAIRTLHLGPNDRLKVKSGALYLAKDGKERALITFSNSFYNTGDIEKLKNFLAERGLLV